MISPRRACHAETPYCHPWPATLYNFHIILYPARYSKKVTKHKMRVLIWFTTLVRKISRSKNERDTIKNVYCSSCKVPFILVRFLIKLLIERFCKNPEISHFIKVHPVVAELFYANGRTDEQT